MLLEKDAKLPVDLFDHSDLSYDTGDDAQVIIHGSIKYLSSYSYLRKVG